MNKVQKLKAAIFLGTGLLIAASYMKGAHPVRVKAQGKPVEISFHLSSVDDWDSPFLSAPATK